MHVDTLNVLSEASGHAYIKKHRERETNMDGAKKDGVSERIKKKKKYR